MLLFGLTLLAGAPAAAQDAPPPALEALLAEDFLWVRGSGAVGGRSEFIRALSTGDLDIEPFRPREARWFVSGDQALLTGLNILQGCTNGVRFTDPHRFGDLWQLQGGRWRLLYAQVTRTADEAGPSIGPDSSDRGEPPSVASSTCDAS
jgi:hypothetical protein